VASTDFPQSHSFYYCFERNLVLAWHGGIPWAGAFGIMRLSDMWTRRIFRH